MSSPSSNTLVPMIASMRPDATPSTILTRGRLHLGKRVVVCSNVSQSSTTTRLDPIESHRLVKRAEAARFCGLSPKAWDSYWIHHDDLRKGVRTTRVPDSRPGRGSGQAHRKWPLYVLLRHTDVECR